MRLEKFDSATASRAETSRQITVADGTLEALKWLALALMTLDHINTFLFERTLPGAFEAGRVAMPLFSFVIACNLARPGALERGIIRRTIKRLAFFGALATPFFIGFGTLANGWWPLNIMFTFLVATGVIGLLQRRGSGNVIAAALLFLAGGALVEYVWVALLVCLAAWWYCRRTSWPALVAMIAAVALLQVINGNFWAVAALPIILAAPYLQLRIPRVRYAFYIYYPAHLAVLLIIDRHWNPGVYI